MQPSQPGPRRKDLRKTLRGVPAQRRSWYQTWIATTIEPSQQQEKTNHVSRNQQHLR